MRNDMKVSVVMPVYNAEMSVGVAINSVLNQSFSDLELIIVDDCSKDGSLDIVNKIDDSRIIVLKNSTNMGVAYSRNKGIKKSQNEYIAFIDSDDIWEVNKLEKQLPLFESFDIIGASYKYIWGGREKVVSMPLFITINEFVRKKERVCFSSIILRKKLIENLFFDEIGHEDFLFLYRAIDASRKKIMGFQNDCLVNYVVSDNSLSSSKLKAALWHWNILKNSLGFGMFKSLFLFYYYVLQALRFRAK